MLEGTKVAARIPAQDLQRARAFYAEKLGLEPSEERPGGLLYRCGEGEFALFESAGAASGDHTFTPGGFLYRSEPGTEEVGGFFCGCLSGEAWRYRTGNG